VPTEDRIYKTRDKELRLISRYLDINGILRELLFATQPIITFVMFMVALYGMNNSLSRIDVIRIIAFLNITRLPLNLLGVAMKSLKDGVVSSERLERFLQSSTVKNSMRTGVSCCVEDPKVHLANACFSWSVSGSDSFLRSDAGQCCIPVSDGDSVVPPSAAFQDRCDDDNGIGNSNDEYDDALVDEAVGNDLTQATTSIEAAAYEEGLDLDIRDIYCCNEDHHLDEQEQSSFTSMQQESRMVDTDEDRLESDSSHSFKLDISSFQTRTSNELIAVIGSVGSGKSSFMAAILGEIPLVVSRDSNTATTIDQQASTTTVTVHGPISYCSQTAWIQNMTLRENVLFGISLDANPELKQSYQEVLRAAALVPDLKVLPFGDDTESKMMMKKKMMVMMMMIIVNLNSCAYRYNLVFVFIVGERGINLSGGKTIPAL
jgi:ABC-type multidrug transport system fused ATPase/permease subunit